MDDIRLQRHYRSTGIGWKPLVYNYLLTDRYFRTLFHFGPQCGALTAITCFLVALVFAYTITSWYIFHMNLKKFNDLSYESAKKLPRKQSVLQVKPAYNCINKHLQQTEVFLDKTSKVVTFSKGWGPGKRAALQGGAECQINDKSLALIFHSLLAELKRSMACDHQAAVNYLQAQIGEH